MSKNGEDSAANLLLNIESPKPHRKDHKSMAELSTSLSDSRAMSKSDNMLKVLHQTSILKNSPSKGSEELKKAEVASHVTIVNIQNSSSSSISEEKDKAAESTELSDMVQLQSTTGKTSSETPNGPEVWVENLKEPSSYIESQVSSAQDEYAPKPVLEKQASGNLSVKSETRRKSILRTEPLPKPRTSVSLKASQSLRGASSIHLHAASKRSVGARSSGSSSNNSSINIMESLYYRFINSWIYRTAERLMETLIFEIVIRMFILTGLSLLICLGVRYIPQQILPSIAIYNIVHVVGSVCSHFYVVTVYDLVGILKRAIIAGKLTAKSCTIEMISASRFSKSVPGFSLRTLSVLFSLFTVILVMLFSYDLHWIPNEHAPVEGNCVKASYYNTTLPENGYLLGNYLQGELIFGLVQNFGYPLEDGMIGGFSSWPTSISSSSFIINNDGPVFVTTASCLDAIVSPTIIDPVGTAFTLKSHREVKNSMIGSIEIYYPPYTLAELSSATGTIQVCDFEISIGQGVVGNRFEIDSWGNIKASVETIEVGNLYFDNSATYVPSYSNSVIPILKEDKYSMIPVISSAIQQMYNGTVYYSTQGTLSTNLMVWATDIDGYYHEDKTFQGVSGSLAVLINFVFDQFDATHVGTCTILIKDGSGTLDVGNASSVTILILISISLVYFFMCVQILFIALAYKIDGVTNVASLALAHPMRMAHDMYKNGNSIFQGSKSGYRTTTRDIMEHIKSYEVSYGIHRDSMDTEEEIKVGFGVKKEVIHIRRIIDKLRRKDTERAGEDEGSKI